MSQNINNGGTENIKYTVTYIVLPKADRTYCNKISIFQKCQLELYCLEPMINSFLIIKGDVNSVDSYFT